jgi:fructokinase
MRIGIDLGGTKIEGIALDDRGRERDRRRLATPVGDYDATLTRVAALVGDIERRSGPAASIGVGIPGTVSRRTGVVKNANATWLNGRALDRDLSACLGRPVRLANDANCFAVSEAVDGAGAGAGVVFGVILGTGVGGGVVVGGRVLEGINGIAGEWGHVPLPWPEADERPGPACYCGRSGCVETFLSGPGFARLFRETTGRTLTAMEIADLAEDGDAACAEAVSRYEQRLARALAVVVDIVDPEVIVLGGGMSNMAGLYTSVPRLLSEWVFSNTLDTRVVRNRHGDSSGVRGAAWLWPPSGGTAATG